MEKLDVKDPLDHLDCLVSRVLVDQEDLKVEEVHLVPPVCLDLKDRRVELELMDLRDPQEYLDPLDLLVTEELLDCLDPLDQLDHEVLKVLKENVEILEAQERKVLQDPRVFQDPLDPLDPEEKEEKKVLLVNKELPVSAGVLVTRVLLELLELWDLLEVLDYRYVFPIAF